MKEYGVITEAGTVRFERLLPGPIERVWSYLTDSEKRGTWLAAGEIEPRIGGRVEHIFNNSQLTDKVDAPPAKYAQYAGEHRMHGVVTAYDPPRLLAYTWGEPEMDDTEVTYELTPQGDKVRLVLTHRRLTVRGHMVGAAGGWHAHLGILADRLNDRDPHRFWPTFARLEAEYEERIPVD